MHIVSGALMCCFAIYKDGLTTIETTGLGCLTLCCLYPGPAIWQLPHLQVSVLCQLVATSSLQRAKLGQNVSNRAPCVQVNVPAEYYWTAQASANVQVSGICHLMDAGLCNAVKAVLMRAWPGTFT